MTGVPVDIRLALLRQYGGFTQAYSATFQPGLMHFGDARGFLACKNVWGTAMVLADPVAPADLADDLIDRFLCENPDAAFWDISYPVARSLAIRGFRVNELGIETGIDLASYTFHGQQKRNLRKATRKAAQLGYVFRERPLADVDRNIVRAVSDAWRQTRTIGRREVTFLNRPITFEEEPDVRWFFAYDRMGTMVACCICDPVYDAGAVVGYSASTRQRLDADGMIGHALKRHVIETLQREGKQRLTFGLSPVEGDAKIGDFERDWAVRRGLRYAFRNPLFNRYIYSLQGHAAHKRQFGGNTQQSFLAFNKGLGVVRLIKMLRACEII
jgi:phosphatidylglycerol lysyltransferase